ncbi:unnamed protein product [Lampetra planeri]
MAEAALQQLLKVDGNEACADCGLSGPEWASYSLGVFLCRECSSIHANLRDTSKIKSTRADKWNDEQVQFMASLGNKAVKAKYEKHVPPFYYRPKPNDCQVVREQWIRAKYERQEFIFTDRQEPYSAGYREGVLWKRGRDNGQFLQRKFILSEKEGSLKYFTKFDASEPKATVKIADINPTFQPTKIGNPNGLQITYLKDFSTRNIFIYHEEGKEIVDWYNAIRAARFHYHKVAFPGSQDVDLIQKLSRNYIKEGYMEKTGPRQREGFKKRWCTLDAADRRLMYFKDPLDAFAKGEVFLGHSDHGYSVQEGLPGGTQGYRWQFGITITTPDRGFLFACEKEADQQEWIGAFKSIIARSMCPQDYVMEAYFKHKP